MAGTAHAASKGSAGRAVAEKLSIQVNNDRLTVTVARVPQIYLYGVIDVDAPQRFEAMVRSGKIPQGSDIYLNSPKGDLAAGLALGRLFRTHAMATHLGTPRRTGRSGYQGSKTAVCMEACVYAYFGGLYRWAPTGSDRMGLIANRSVGQPVGISTPAQPSPAQTDAYLREMGIDLRALPAAKAAAPDSLVWLTADDMTFSGLANNGKLPIKTKTRLLPPRPYLELEQDDRHGNHRLTFECAPGNITVTAYDRVGPTRAREIVAAATRSYFEVNRQEVLTQPSGGASAVNGEVVISRPYPPNELVRLLSSRTVGGWVGGRTSAFRYGHNFVLYPARDAISEFYNACWRAAPWQVKKRS